MGCGGSKPLSWKVSDVVAFLHTHDLGMHAEAFKTHSVDGKILLTLTDQEMLETLKIVSPVQRRRLKEEIATLNNAKLYVV